MAEQPADDDRMSRRTMLKLTGAGIAASAVGSGSAAAQADDTETAAAAKAAVAEETGTDPEDLTVIHEGVASYQTLDDEYYDATVLDETDHSTHTIRFDENGDRVDPRDVRERAEEARKERHGKLGRHLDDRLEESGADEEIPITVWTESVDRGAARRAAGVAGEPPTAAAREALSEEIVSRISARTQGLARALDAKPGVDVEHAETASPSVLATATPAGIERIEQHPQVRRIFERVDDVVPDLQEAAQTHDSYDDAAGGPKYDASGYKVGIFDVHVPDDDTYFNLAEVRDEDGTGGSSWHANRSSMCAASTDDVEPGMAANADVYAAGIGNTTDDQGIAWFDDNDVPVVNCSWSSTGDQDDRTLRERDFRYDKYAINRALPIVHSAGNYNNDYTYNVNTPARGFNTITAGNVDDANTGGDKRDDEIDSGSCYVNPRSEHDGELTKPEVSAIGGGISFPNGAGGSGTSYSAPQIAGLITLLQRWAATDSEADLLATPELSRSVVMASAVEEGVYSEDEFGTGTIRAPIARDIVQNDQYWVDTISENEEQKFTITDAQEGDYVTVVLNWLSDPDQRPWDSIENARAEIDLNLFTWSPDVKGPVSVSYTPDRCFERVQFQAPSDADLTVEVRVGGWESSDTEREFAVAYTTTTDDEAPQKPPNLSVTDSTPNTLSADWDEAGDQGGTGTTGYYTYVNGWNYEVGDGSVDETEQTFEYLAPGQEYTIGVSARDLEDNEGPTATVSATTESVGELILHDFDGDPAWPGTNDLGNWANASDFENGDGVVDRRALTLDYDSSGWFKSDINRDLSDYTELKMRMRAEEFQDEHFSVSLGGVTDLFENLQDDTIWNSQFRIVTIDMVEHGMDRVEPGSLEFNFWDGESGSGVVHIDQIWFE